MYFFGKLGQEPDSLMCSLDLKQFLILTQFNRCTFFKKKKREILELQSFINILYYRAVLSL